MSGAIWHPYLITPQPELIAILGTEHSLASLSVWESPESTIYGSQEETDSVIMESIVRLKVVFLLNIIIQSRLQAGDFYPGILQKIFKVSSQYIPDMFDMMWTIHRINPGNSNKFEAVLRSSSVGDLSLLGKSGDDSFDNLIKELSEHKRAGEIYTLPHSEIMMVYVIKPKYELVKTLQGEHFLTNISVWYKSEDMSPDKKDGYIIGMKMAFLLDIIKQARYQYPGFSSNIIQLLFGSPADYTPDNFDKWWTIELIRMENHILDLYVYKKITEDDVNLLGASGYNEFDRNMKALAKKKQ